MSTFNLNNLTQEFITEDIKTLTGPSNDIFDVSIFDERASKSAPTIVSYHFYLFSHPAILYAFVSKIVVILAILVLRTIYFIREKMITVVYVIIE